MSKRTRTTKRRPSKNRSKSAPVYSSRVGRSKEDPAVRAADSGTGQALIRLGRAGAGVIYRREQVQYARDGRVRSRKRPKRMSDTGLAGVLHVGSNARGVQKLSSGQRAIARGTSARAVEQLIQHGLLPGYSTWLVPLNDGHARLLAPFEPFMEQLRQLGPCVLPSDHFRRRLKRYVRLYRAAVKDLEASERTERQSFQEARDELIRALLCLRSRMLQSNSLEDDAELRSLSRQAALRGTKLLEVVRSLKSLHIQVRPAPREIGTQWADALFPTSGPEGCPNFGSLFTWLSSNAEPHDVDLHSAIALYREIAGGSWWLPVDQAQGHQPPPKSAKWELVGLYPTSHAELIEEYIDPEPWELTEPEDFSEIREGDDPARYVGSRRMGLSGLPREDLPDADRRFVRHLRRVVGDVKLRAMLLFAMADRWYCKEEQPDDFQSDFEDRVLALCRWVKCVYPGRRQLKFEGKLTALGLNVGEATTSSEIDAALLKRLINELSRCSVRRPIELNLDIPTPTPRRTQFWFRASAKRDKVNGGHRGKARRK